MGYMDSGGQPSGVHWDYLEAIERKSGVCINKALQPYAKIWMSLSKGQHDGGIMFRSPKLDLVTEPLALIRSLRTVVIPKRGIPLKTDSDLKGSRIGKTRSTRLSNSFDSGQTLTKRKLNNYEQAAKMIRMGRLDAIAGSDLLLNYHRSKHQALEYIDIHNGYELGTRKQWLQLSKQSPPKLSNRFTQKGH